MGLQRTYSNLPPPPFFFLFIKKKKKSTLIPHTEAKPKCSSNWTREKQMVHNFLIFTRHHTWIRNYNLSSNLGLTSQTNHYSLFPQKNKTFKRWYQTLKSGPKGIQPSRNNSTIIIFQSLVFFIRKHYKVQTRIRVWPD